MKVTTPTDQTDITLDQFQKFSLIDVENVTEEYVKCQALSIFLGLTDEQINLISQNDKEELVDDITKALQIEGFFDLKKNPTFQLNGVTFGLHPNVSEMSGGEYSNLNSYSGEIEDYHKLMAVLFRPITERDGLGNYSIAAYNGTEKWAQEMKQTPLHIVKSAIFFFKSLAKELRIYIQQSLPAEELAKDKPQPIIG